MDEWPDLSGIALLGYFGQVCIALEHVEKFLGSIDTLIDLQGGSGTYPYGRHSPVCGGIPLMGTQYPRSGPRGK